MKTYTTSLLAGLAGVLLSISSHGQVVTHFDIDFDDYTSGSFGSPGAFTLTDVTGTIEPATGDKYLHFESSSTNAKSLRLSTATNSTTGTQPLVLAASSSYQWKFSFRLHEDPNSPGNLAPLLARLDKGSASTGNFVAGINVSESGALRYMTNPNIGTISSQMALSSFIVEGDTWYDVTFDITTGATTTEGHIPVSYDLNITGGSTSFNVSASYIPTGATFGNSRAMWQASSNSHPINADIDNLYLATIPEPGVAGLLLGSTLLGAFMFRKRVRD